ncbi:MAG: HD domain-containing protein [Firmicutes bacterium]|nr:HD domain-containing protein [Bacillota bacterium]
MTRQGLSELSNLTNLLIDYAIQQLNISQWKIKYVGRDTENDPYITALIRRHLIDEKDVVLGVDQSGDILVLPELEHILKSSNVSEILLPFETNGELAGIMTIDRSELTGLPPARAKDLGRWVIERVEKQLTNLIKETVIIDPETKVYERTYFEEKLRGVIARATLANTPVNLLVCGVEVYGRDGTIATTEQVKRAVVATAQVISQTCRELDVVGRLSEQVFALALIGLSSQEVRCFGEQLQARIKQLDISQQLFILPSIGVASFPRDCFTAEKLLDLSYWTYLYARGQEAGSIQFFSSYQEENTPYDQLKEQLLVHSVEALAAAVDARDHYTAKHSRFVAELSSAIAQALGLVKEEAFQVGMAGLVHDVGKIGVSDSILNKQGPLTVEERQIIQTHPIVGGNIMRELRNLNRLEPAIVHHHERFDGKGYPAGLAGQGIPLPARILAVADAYHAMISDRPYRRRLTKRAALAELEANKNTQFDSRVVDALLKIETGGI